MAIRICDVISDIATALDREGKRDAGEADTSVAKCVAAVTECLKSHAPNFTEIQRAHLHQILLATRHGHFAVRELLRPENEQPLSVNVMPLVRAQIETLYAICLIIETPGALSNYEKDGWKKLFIRHVVIREECRSLSRVTKGLAEVGEG